MSYIITRRIDMTSPEQDPRASEMVVAEGIYKIYDTGAVKVNALRGVTLTVTRGEMVAIMGPSGCGKTTLLNCLSGLDEVDSGAVKIGGTDLAQMSDDEKTRYRAQRMGYIFQAYNLLPVLTAAENVELPLLVSGTRSREAQEKSRTALEMVGLAHQERQYPAELSGGEQQRVTIARALVNQPEIVWADEPTGNLDSANSEEITALMRRLNQEQGITFVIVTHDINVGRKTDRLIRMEDGEIVEELPLGG